MHLFQLHCDREVQIVQQIGMYCICTTVIGLSLLCGSNTEWCQTMLKLLYMIGCHCRPHHTWPTLVVFHLFWMSIPHILHTPLWDLHTCMAHRPWWGSFKLLRWHRSSTFPLSLIWWHCCSTSILLVQWYLCSRFKSLLMKLRFLMR